MAMSAAKPPSRREGWYYLAIIAVVFGGAIFKEVNLLLILAGMLLGPLLLNWRAVRRQSARAERRSQLPLRLCAGDCSRSISV